MAELNAAIKKQIEFYFSESNFRKDAFLKAASETNPEGYVPIAVLLTFNKLKSLSTDVALIALTLKESDTVTVSEDGLNIKRSSEMPESDSSKANTLYVKGYATDDATITIETIGEQFSPYGKVLMVRVRRGEDKGFKGSCFIEFDTEEAVKAAVTASYKDGEMILSHKEKLFEVIMPLVNWLENRANKRVKHSKAKKEGSEGKDDEENDGEQGPSKKRKTEDGDVKEEKVEMKIEYTAGLILQIKDIPVETTMYQLKDLLKTIGDIKYVELKEGESEAIVRVADLTTAESIMQAIEKGLPVVEGGTNLTGSVMMGDEELAYYTKIAVASKNKNSGGRGGGRGGGGRGRGRGGGGRGGRGGRGKRN
jgi:lupus La protein